MKYEKKRFFDMEIDMEIGMGSPYRLDNFFPILFMKYIPYKFAKPMNDDALQGIKEKSLKTKRT